MALLKRAPASEHAHIHTDTQTQTHRHRHRHTHTYTRARTHARTHAHTHIHTHKLNISTHKQLPAVALWRTTEKYVNKSQNEIECYSRRVDYV